MVIMEVQPIEIIVKYNGTPVESFFISKMLSDSSLKQIAENIPKVKTILKNEFYKKNGSYKITLSKGKEEKFIDFTDILIAREV
jgi:hypothetical protein